MEVQGELKKKKKMLQVTFSLVKSVFSWSTKTMQLFNLYKSFCDILKYLLIADDFSF